MKTKRDQFERGYIYGVTLPDQGGAELHGHHRCILLSNDDLNDEGRGFVMVPLTSARENGKEKFDKPRRSWVRVLSNGEYAFALCEQIRYVDRYKVGKCYGSLVDYDLSNVEQKVKGLLGAVVR